MERTSFSFKIYSKGVLLNVRSCLKETFFCETEITGFKCCGSFLTKAEMSVTIAKGSAAEALSDSVLNNMKGRMRNKNETLKKVKLNNSLVSKIKSKNLNNSSIIKISLKHNNRALALAFNAEKEKNRNLINEKMLLQKEIQTLAFDRSLVRQSVNQLKEALQAIWTCVNSKVSEVLDSSSAEDEYTVQPPTVKFSDLKTCRANSCSRGDMTTDVPTTRRFGMPMRVPVSKGEVEVCQSSADSAGGDQFLKEPPKGAVVLEPKEPHEQLQPSTDSISSDCIEHMEHALDNNTKCSQDSISSRQHVDEPLKLTFYSMPLPDNVTTRRKRSTLTNSGRLIFPISFDEEKCEIQPSVLENTALENCRPLSSWTKELNSASISVPCATSQHKYESSFGKTGAVAQSQSGNLQTEETMFAEMELTASEVGEITTVAKVCNDQNAGRKMATCDVSAGKQENICEGGMLRKVKQHASTKNRSKHCTNSDDTDTVEKGRKKRKHDCPDSVINEFGKITKLIQIPEASNVSTGSKAIHESLQGDHNPDLSYSCPKIPPSDLAFRSGLLSSPDACMLQLNMEKSEHANLLTSGSDVMSATCSMENQCKANKHSQLSISEAKLVDLEDARSQANCNAFLESPNERDCFKIPRKMKTFNSRETIVLSCRTSDTGSVNDRVPELPLETCPQVAGTEVQTEGDHGKNVKANSPGRKKEKKKDVSCEDVARERAKCFRKANEPLNEINEIYCHSQTVKFNTLTKDACIAKPDKNKDYDLRLPLKPSVKVDGFSENAVVEPELFRNDKSAKVKPKRKKACSLLIPSESCTVEHPVSLLTQSNLSEPAVQSPLSKRSTEPGKFEDNLLGAVIEFGCPKEGKDAKEKPKRETFVISSLKLSKNFNAEVVGLEEDISTEFSDFFAKPTPLTETGVELRMENATGVLGCTRKGKDVKESSKRKTFILSSEKNSNVCSAESSALELLQEGVVERSDFVIKPEFLGTQMESGIFEPPSIRAVKELGCTKRGKGAKQMSKRKTFIIRPVKHLENCTAEQLISRAVLDDLAESSDPSPQPERNSEREELCTAEMSSSSAVKELVCSKKGKDVKQKSKCKSSAVKPSESCNVEQAPEADGCSELLKLSVPSTVTQTGTLKTHRNVKEFGCGKKGKDAKLKSNRKTHISSADHFEDTSVVQPVPRVVEERSVEWSNPSLKSELEALKVPRKSTVREFGCVEKGKQTQQKSKRETVVLSCIKLTDKCSVEQASDLTQGEFTEMVALHPNSVPAHQTEHEMIDMICDSILLNCSADKVLDLESPDVVKPADFSISPQKTVSVCTPDGVLPFLLDCNPEVLQTRASILSVRSQHPSSRNEEQEEMHQKCLQTAHDEQCQKMKAPKNRSVLRDLTNKGSCKASPKSPAPKDQDNTGRRLRRAAINVHYKEPDVKSKIRQGDDASFLNNDHLNLRISKKKSNKVKFMNECGEDHSSVSAEVSGQYC